MRIFAHGWFTVNGEKMSKSLGNVVNPLHLIEKYGLTATRYYMMKCGPHKHDVDFREELIAINYNADVVNCYANLAHRTLSLIYKNCDKKIPPIGKITSEEMKMMQDFPSDKLHEHQENFDLDKYAIEIMNYCRSLNTYIDQQKPWELKKTDKERMDTVLYILFDMIRIATIFLRPTIPEVGKVLRQMGIPEEEWFFKLCIPSGGEYSGREIEEPAIIFRRIDQK